MQDGAKLTRAVVVVDGIPQADPAATDGTRRVLGGKEALTVLEGCAMAGSTSRNRRSVFLAKDAPIARLRGASYALATPSSEETIMGLVQQQPLPMLSGLPLTGRKPRRTISRDFDRVALAVLQQACLVLLRGHTGTTSLGHGAIVPEGRYYVN
jgi:hypothetical protein